LSLSRAALGGIDVRELALPVMRHLVDRIHITTTWRSLTTRGGLRGKSRSAEFYQDEYWIGRDGVALHRSGKSLLAYLDSKERDAILRQRGLEELTTHTITTLSAPVTGTGARAAVGYAVDDEENSLGARCVGAPIFNGDGQAEAAIASTASSTMCR